MTEIDYGRLAAIEAALGGRAAIYAAYLAGQPIVGSGGGGSGTDPNAVEQGSAAGGDLTGTFPNPTVAKVAGQTPAQVVSANLPASVVTDTRGVATQDILVFSGSTFVRLKAGSAGQDLVIRSDGTVTWVARAVIPVAAWGYKADSGGTDNTAPINNALAALPATGGTIEFPASASFAQCTGTITVGARQSVLFKGAGGLTAGASAASFLTYTGTTRFVDARGSLGFKMEDLSLWPTNNAFNGVLVDVSSTTTATSYYRIKDCLLLIPGAAAGGVAIAGDTSQNGTIRGCHISGGQYGFQGIATSGHQCNAVRLLENTFRSQTVACIAGLGSGCKVDGNTFEIGTTPTGIQDTFSNMKGGAIIGNWLGDATGSNQTIIQAGSGQSITGNTIGGTATSIGVDATGKSNNTVTGNDFETHLVGIKLTATSQDNAIYPNTFNGCATPYTTPTVAAGAAAGSGAGATIAGADAGGKISVTAGASGTAAGVLATVTYAQLHAKNWPTITPGNAAAQACGPYISLWSTTGFTLSCAVAPAASAALTFLFATTLSQ